MENLENKQITEKTKMQILRSIHEIIWDANRLLEKVAYTDDQDFDYEHFKHDVFSSYKFLHNDLNKLLHIEFE